jgi:hypothetical protein
MPVRWRCYNPATVVVDRWAFTEQSHLQRHELGTATIVILVIGGLLTVGMVVLAIAILWSSSVITKVSTWLFPSAPSRMATTIRARQAKPRGCMYGSVMRRFPT